MEWVVEANNTEEMADGKFAVISELVRCKDCKYHEYEEPGMVYCPTNIVGGWVEEDFFCKDGERRE